MNRTTACALALILIVGSLLAAPALAQFLGESTTTAASSAFPVSADESLWPSIGRLAITLVLVLGLIVGTLWLARKVTRRGWGGSQAAVRVIERTHLAPKKSIEVVAIGERILVIGVTDTNIALLTELEPDELPDLDPKSATPEAMRQRQLRQKNILKQAQQRMQEMFSSSRLPAVENTPNA